MPRLSTFTSISDISVIQIIVDINEGKRPAGPVTTRAVDNGPRKIGRTEQEVKKVTLISLPPKQNE